MVKEPLVQFLAFTEPERKYGNQPPYPDYDQCPDKRLNEGNWLNLLQSGLP